MNDTEEKHATHTPGPWHARGTKISIFQPFATAYQVVATAEDEANARLIAAAPEMYEKLCEICNVITALEEKGVNIPYHYFKDDMSMSDKLREVLAKVDGGEG